MQLITVYTDTWLCSGAPDGIADMNTGNAMLAARQAATAQLELFRAEMAAESAKMRAVVERQVHACSCCCAPAAIDPHKPKQMLPRIVRVRPTQAVKTLVFVDGQFLKASHWRQS